MSKVVEITNPDQYREFKRNKRGIIFYGAEWCDACQQIDPYYKRIARHYHKRITFAHADINVCKLDFSRVPVFVTYHKGKEINSMEGASDEGLKSLIKEAILFDENINNNDSDNEDK